jgi:hypothetical protein
MDLPEPERKPACVLACPTNARFFGDVDDPESAVSKKAAERSGYALMPDQQTRPSNLYLPKRHAGLSQPPPIAFNIASSALSPGGAPPQTVSPDRRPVKIHGRAGIHPPFSLIFFTILTGLGVGGYVATYLTDLMIAPSGGFVKLAALMSLALMGLGNISAVFHLTHPQRMVYAFNRWRSSWLSREGIFATAMLFFGGLYLLLTLFPLGPPWAGWVLGG